VDEFSDAASTERRGDALPADHPAADLAAAEDDCVSHIPAEVKDAAAATQGNREPPDSQVRAGELV
jgi:hypothetical protein